MKEYNPDVLIYVNKMKNFLNSDEESFKFFLSNTNNEKFFNELIETSQKNLTENGSPEVTRHEYVQLRMNTWNKPIYLDADNGGRFIFSLN